MLARSFFNRCALDCPRASGHGRDLPIDNVVMCLDFGATLYFILFYVTEGLRYFPPPGGHPPPASRKRETHLFVVVAPTSRANSHVGCWRTHAVTSHTGRAKSAETFEL
jgi:hypothetical protein